MICCPQQEHGLITQTPLNLHDLHDLVHRAGGVDLLGMLRARLLGWKDSSPRALDSHLLFVLTLPKVRSPGGAVESSDVWAFCTSGVIREIGEAVGRWEVRDNSVGVLIQADESKVGEGIQLLPLNVSRAPSRTNLALFNGHEGPAEIPIAAVGVGALGSQVLMIAARSAFGRWTLIDDDLLLPHNISRHAAILGPELSGIGQPKAAIVAGMANGLVEDPDPAVKPMVVDVLDPGAKADELAEVFRSAGVILDMSASVTVARALAIDVEGGGRRISLFLNPMGDDLVMLAEDRDRRSTLDSLEMQYYRALLRNEKLGHHLRHSEERIRYGRSCRDVSSKLAQERVALHAAIGASALRSTLNSDKAAIRVWRVDAESFGVTSVSVSPASAQEFRLGTWTVYMDSWILGELANLRRAKLPCETGGILIGTFDLERKRAYVVDTISSPLDSEEWPFSYIRGCVGLERRVEEVVEVTAEQLHYIGEWHSHPEGFGCAPSSADLQAFAWLAEKMDADGLPALMLIIGSGNRVAPYLGHMVAGQESYQCLDAVCLDAVSVESNRW